MSARIDHGRPSAMRILAGLTGHGLRGFWRAPMALFFTLAFPLIFLILFSSLFGNELIDGTNVRFSQFITPSIAVLAAITGALTSLAIGLAVDRDLGILKRIRSTPARPWMFMVARVTAMALVSILATLIMVAVGVIAFDVQIVGDKLAAAVLTLVLGIASFCMLGLAIAAVSPSSEATSAIANGVVIPLAFISEVFVIDGDLPRWLDVLGWVFPVKHFAVGLQDTFNPFTPGSGFGWDHLAAMTAWGAVALGIALWRFRWEPAVGRSTVNRKAPRTRSAPQDAVGLGAPVDAGRPSAVQLLATQVRYGVLAFVRTRASAFFTLVFPPLLLVIFSFVFGNPEMPNRGVRLLAFAAPALAVYGVAVAAYADFSERVALLRDRGVLKRVRGTPLPAWAYVAGRMGATVLVALASLVITMTVGVVFFDANIVPRMLGGVVVTVALGIGTFTALGLALAAVVARAESVPTIANATLLPLAFFSDIFLLGDTPRWMEIIGWLFPLKHFVNAVADGFNPTIPGAGFFMDHLLVMAVWCAVAVWLALRFFTWQPRAADRSRTSPGASEPQSVAA